MVCVPVVYQGCIGHGYIHDAASPGGRLSANALGCVSQWLMNADEG
jgi:hypothetical protein